MGLRGDRRRLRATRQKESKSRNGLRKIKQRDRKDERMRSALKAGQLPYDRYVRNWLSEQLGKKEARITQVDVDGLLVVQN